MKKWNRKPGKNAGFTLIEMLIVVAIIAVLVAVSIPLLTNELEKSRDRTDEANERAAKSAANLVWLGAIDNHEPGDQGIFYYDAAAGRLIDIDGPAPEPYGKCKVAHEERFVGGDGPHDTDHSNGYLTVKIKEGEITMSWGSLEDTATPTCGCGELCNSAECSKDCREDNCDHPTCYYHCGCGPICESPLCSASCREGSCDHAGCPYHTTITPGGDGDEDMTKDEFLAQQRQENTDFYQWYLRLYLTGWLGGETWKKVKALDDADFIEFGKAYNEYFPNRGINSVTEEFRKTWSERLGVSQDDFNAALFFL